MSKRRTRKQKEKAKHSFIRLDEALHKKEAFEAVVKGQFKKTHKTKQKRQLGSKRAIELAKDVSFAQTKSEIIKSLILASLILALEVMIYLVWQA